VLVVGAVEEEGEKMPKLALPQKLENTFFHAGQHEKKSIFLISSVHSRNE
jgi:hypothetical protein